MRYRDHDEADRMRRGAVSSVPEDSKERGRRVRAAERLKGKKAWKQRAKGGSDA